MINWDLFYFYCFTIVSHLDCPNQGKKRDINSINVHKSQNALKHADCDGGKISTCWVAKYFEICLEGS